MVTHHPGPATSPAALLDAASLEITGKDLPAVEAAAQLIPAGTRINVTFLAHEDLPTRVAAAAGIRRLGFEPVPHISARRLRAESELREFLDVLRLEAQPSAVFVIGGDPDRPAGPYGSSLDVIRSGVLGEYGIAEVGIAGYPDGHPDIGTEELWSALRDKDASLAEQGLRGHVITQFGFDPDPVLAWLAEVRRAGVSLPVRVGVPGPAGIKRLLAYARRFGISSSASIAQKYGLSLTNLLGTAGPDRFLEAFAGGLEEQHGEVLLHFYTFGGLQATAGWIEEFRRRHQ